MSKPLSPGSTLTELFDELRPDSGMRVVPIQLSPRDDSKVDLMIAITGKAEDANVLFANLMHYVDEMAAVAEQHEADSEIVGSDGSPLKDEPSIIVP